MVRGAWLGIATAVALLVAGSSLLHAQPSAKRAALKLLSDGDAKLERGDKFRDRGNKAKANDAYAEALADYKRAHDAFPSPKIYLPIAQAEERLGRHINAFRHYQQVLDEAEGLKAQNRQRARRGVASMKKKLGAFVFKVKPDGASISVDGDEVGTAPLPEPVWLAPGDHTFSITLNGYETVEGTSTLEPGEPDEHKVALEKLTLAATKKPLAGKGCHRRFWGVGE